MSYNLNMLARSGMAINSLLKTEGVAFVCLEEPIVHTPMLALKHFPECDSITTIDYIGKLERNFTSMVPPKDNRRFYQSLTHHCLAGGFRRDNSIRSAHTSPDKSVFRGFRLTDANGGIGVIPTIRMAKTNEGASLIMAHLANRADWFRKNITDVIASKFEFTRNGMKRK